MKSKHIIILITLIAILVTIFYSMQGSQDDTTYVQSIEKERKENENFMRTSKESPFASLQEKFSGLKYYPPDPKYRIISNLHPVDKKNVRVIATSDGKEERYLEYAFAEFELDGVHNKLLILELMGMGPMRGKLFLAFADETSGGETYGAGRYLDVKKVPGSTTMTLDFNKAYNPYCAYNDSYSCPFPPQENLLKVAIKAGEKNYSEH